MEEKELIKQESQYCKGQELPSEEDPRREEDIVIAVLFSLGRAVTAREMAKALDTDADRAGKVCDRVLDRYEREDGALIVRRLEGKYQICTNPKYYPELTKLVKTPQKPVLTDVVLETLAIIAYKAPVTKVMIEKIRGVKSDHAVNKLIEYGLVEETGRLDAPGRPALFAPTDEFYRRFGVSGKDELPGVDPETEDIIEEEVKEEVREAFSGGVELAPEEDKD